MEMKERLAEILARYKEKKGALIPVLQQVQSELGYLPREAVSEIARFLGTSGSEVFGVASFYAQFRFSRAGRHTVKVCLGTSCYVRGGARVMAMVEKELGIRQGETTTDYEFTLERVACFGCCALSPVMVVDNRVYSRMTPAKAKQVLSFYH